MSKVSQHSTIPSKKFTYNEMPKDASLEVNTDFSKHQVFEKSEEQGIKDLRQLCQNAHREEAWIYVQGQDTQTGKSKEFWYEVGNFETGVSFTSNCKHLEYIKEDLASKGVKVQEWSQYHFHPQKSETFDTHGNQKTKTIKNKYLDKTISPEDYVASAKLEQYRQTHLPDTPPIDNKVVTSEGIWTSKLTQELEIPEDKRDIKRYINRPARKYARSEKRQDRSCYKKGHCEMDHKKIEKNLSTPYMEVDYEAFVDKEPDLDKAIDINRLQQTIAAI